MTLARLTDALGPAAASGKGLAPLPWPATRPFLSSFTSTTPPKSTWSRRPSHWACGLDVEAELGEVGGKDGVHAAGARTRPQEAEAFVRATGVDALGVAVGSSHAMTERHVLLDLELIMALHASVPVPLVLHGSSGVPDQELVRAVEAGMTKINIATHLNAVFTDSIRATLAGNPQLVDSRRYLGPARDAVSVEATRLLRLLSGL